jgi:hypothetical protein
MHPLMKDTIQDSWNPMNECGRFGSRASGRIGCGNIMSYRNAVHEITVEVTSVRHSGS